jgi:hypothetical protein
MPTPRDILALEPYYGGERRAMLETIVRHSRHRWTVLRLPPRRIERRLAAAAQWFAEQLSRHGVGKVDVLFTSEAINLPDLLRLMPELGTRARVVYFHDHQLPQEGQRVASPLHLVNLSTAGAANEIWFNSLFHLRTFLRRASALVDAHPELAARNPLPELTGKAQVMPPPVDFARDGDLLADNFPPREPRTVLVHTRESEIETLNAGLGVLERRGERITVLAIGDADRLDIQRPRVTVPENDEAAVTRALYQAGVYLSCRARPLADVLAVRALNAGCWPVFPKAGVYAELLPRSMHALCLYDPGELDRLATLVQNSWFTEPPAGYEAEVARIVSRFNALEACHAIDQRLEQLAASVA